MKHFQRTLSFSQITKTVTASAFVVGITLMSPAFAQMYGEAFHPGVNRPASGTAAVSIEDGPILQGATMGTIGPQGVDESPVLQGATMGTIGPQGSDLTCIEGVNTSGIVRTPTVAPMSAIQSATNELPLVPTILLSTLAVSAVGYGLRLLIQKKRAPLWMLGSIAALVVLLAGFLWANIKRTENVPQVADVSVSMDDVESHVAKPIFEVDNTGGQPDRHGFARSAARRHGHTAAAFITNEGETGHAAAALATPE